MLLFTTDRTVVAKASSVASGVRSQAERMARGTQIGVVDEILSDNEKNYAIPHSEITQLRVKLPRVLHRGTVTFTTAQGEEVFKIAQKATPIKALSSSKQIIPYVNPYPADWEFLKSPPPKLAGKLVVEGPLCYVGGE